ncbi:MAG: carbohydrate transporter substrate-binding protein, partial [Frankiales bacterium]|nr:carbohydrate transporter substrate-binding protein [Frankiales bacterium]
MRQRQPGGTALSVVLAVTVLALFVGCSTPDGSADLKPAGQTVEVLATWAGSEQASFEAVLQEFERRSGARVTYTSTQHRMPEELGRRLAAGDPPDVALLPQPGLLRELAGAGHLIALDAPTRELVAASYSSVFEDLGSSGGQLYGVWFKLADKSLVWYDVATFERLGEVPPSDLAGLLSLARRLSAAGTAPFAVPAADGWTLTDWFENLFLRLAGPQAYDDLAAHRIPWTSPLVIGTLRSLDELLAPEHIWRGPSGAVRTTFEDAVDAVFARPSQAAMLVEGDFVAGLADARTGARRGVDADVFAFPAGPDAAPGIVAGGDVAVLLRASDAGRALLRFLATDEAARIWAAKGGFLSPNLDLDLGAYPDAVSRAVARQLLEAGDALHFDLSDLQPAAFGGS